jgi:hypothetical protein
MWNSELKKKKDMNVKGGLLGRRASRRERRGVRVKVNMIEPLYMHI